MAFSSFNIFSNDDFILHAQKNKFYTLFQLSFLLKRLLIEIENLSQKHRHFELFIPQSSVFLFWPSSFLNQISEKLLLTAFQILPCIFTFFLSNNKKRSRKTSINIKPKKKRFCKAFTNVESKKKSPFKNPIVFSNAHFRNFKLLCTGKKHMNQASTIGQKTIQKMKTTKQT